MSHAPKPVSAAEASHARREGAAPAKDASQPDAGLLGASSAPQSSQPTCGVPVAGDGRARDLPRELVVLRDPVTGEPVEVG